MRLFRPFIWILWWPTPLILAAEPSGIDTYVRAEIELNDVPGAAVAIWHDNRIIFARGSAFEARPIANQ